MAQPKSAHKAKPKSAPAPLHHLQFALCDPNFAPITEPRKYRLVWKNTGEQNEQVEAGSTDGAGLTALIKTKGKVPVTLEIAPPDGSDCKLVGSTASHPADKKPLVKVQLKVAVKAISAPKPSKMCEVVEVREGAQRIQFEIHNVPSYKSLTSGSKYESYLSGLPYLIVNADTLEVISDSAAPQTTAKKMSGDKTKVKTEIVNVDGIANVGLVLGSATDDPSIWKAAKGKLIYFKTQPKALGLTTVIINEVSKTESLESPTVARTKDFKGELNGAVWASICRSFTVADVKRILPGSLEIVAAKPNEMQISYAQGRGVITEVQAAIYRAALAERQTLAPAPAKGAKPVKAPPPLAFACPWSELLAPIYEAQIQNGEPPNPDVPDIDPNTKKQKVDPVTKRPVTKKKFDDALRDKLVLQGDGQILIKPLGLTLELSGPLVAGGEAMAQNAQEVTGLPKGKVIAKTHPFAYVALLESCMECGVTYALINCTWRPMIGSVLHKLGDAIDIGKIDSDSGSLKPFKFVNTKVDALADRFTKALNGHRYAAPGKTIYNLDNLPANAPFHDNHLHFTADRLKPLAEQDKPRPPMADQPAKPK
jgi:hypothetical protein